MNRLLACYGLRGYEEKWFDKRHLEINDTIAQVSRLIPEMKKYYVPCKAKVYLNDIGMRRAITILSQHLRVSGYTLERKERFVNHKKIVWYRIVNEEEKLLRITNQPNHVMFD